MPMAENGAGSTILVVDDEPVNRDILLRRLKRLGHDVVCAANGKEGLEILGQRDCDLVLLDIMMPVMDGMTMLHRLRLDYSSSLLPVIITTARDGSEEVVAALEAGANDYVTKPIDFPVLLARLKTQLKLRGVTVELERAYARIKQEIETAARIQRSQIPDQPLEMPGLRCVSRYLPCEELGGDILNYFPLDQEQMALYLLDVSGHGAGAAMLSSGLSRLLAPPEVELSLLRCGGESHPKRRMEDEPENPSTILSRLNRRFPLDLQTSQFFTILYASIDASRRLLRFSSAGHPGPLLMNSHGETSYHGSTGLPVGVVEDAVFAQQEISLAQGDTVIFFSDGIIEARNRDEEQFGLGRVEEVLRLGRGRYVDDILDTLLLAVQEWCGGVLQDDASLVGLQIVR